MNLYGDPLCTADPSEVETTSKPKEDAPRDRATPAKSISPTGPSPFQRCLASIKSHPWVFVAVTLLFTTTAAWGVHKKFRPVYRSESELQIAPLAPRVLYTDEEWHKESFANFYGEFVQTLSRKVESARTLEAAIARLEAEGVPWMPETLEAKEKANHLRARLDVKRLRDSHFLTITFDDANPRVTAAVVNAVAESFIDQHESTRQSETGALLASLEKEESTLKADLEATYGELDKLSGRLGAALIDNRQNIFYERIQLLEQGLTKVFLRRAEAEGALGAAKHRAVQLLTTIPEGEIREEIERDSRIKDARVMVARRMREIDDQILGLGPKHPHRKIYVARRNDLMHEILKLEKKVREEVCERLASRRDQEAERILSDAERELEALKNSEKTMKVEMQEAKEDLVDYGRAMFEGTRLRGEAQRILAEMNKIGTRIASVRTEAAAPSRVKVHQLGKIPGKPNKDRRLLFWIAATVLGVMVGAAACFAWDQLHYRRWQRSMA